MTSPYLNDVDVVSDFEYKYWLEIVSELVEERSDMTMDEAREVVGTAHIEAKRGGADSGHRLAADRVTLCGIIEDLGHLVRLCDDWIERFWISVDVESDIALFSFGK